MSAAETPVVGVGTKLWWFDQNRRVYAKDERGRSVGSPIWREHWAEREILGETRVSWLIGFPGGHLHSAVKVAKVAFKDGACPSGWALTQAQIDDAEFVQLHAWKLGDAVRRCGDVRILREVARLVGYVP